MTATRTLCPIVAISWDGSGTFAGAFDNVTRDTASDPGLTIDIGKDGTRTLDPPQATAADFELFNDSGRYSQERADSPVYQLVLPGRPVAISATTGESDEYDAPTLYTEDDYYDGTATYVLARGVLDQITQTVSWGNRRVGLRTVGVETLLLAATVTVPLMVGPRVDQCISALLDAVHWPAAHRDIAVADTVLTYWWCDDRTPWDALIELLASEGPGAIWFSPTDDLTGVTLHFENRNYRATQPRSTTSQAVFFDVQQNTGPSSAYTYDDPYTTSDLYDAATSGLWFTDLTYEPGYDAIRNAARYSTNARALGAAGTVIWTYPATLTLAASQAITLIAKPSEPFQNAIAPVSGTDYTVSGGTVTVSLNATSGLVAFITITATSGTPTVTALQLRATPLTVVSSTDVANSVDASTSILKFSPVPGQPIARVFDVPGWPEINQAYAEAVCNAWIARYMVQRPAVEITVQAADAAHLRQILERTVSDRITLTERNTGLQADVWVNGKQIVIDGAGGRHVVAVLRCEKVDEVSGSRWDFSSWDSAVWGI